MSIIIFGNGPMANEPEFSVTAPGSRTWQIVRTVAEGLVQAGTVSENILVIALDETPRPAMSDTTFNVNAAGQDISVEFRPLPYEDFITIGTDASSSKIPQDVRAVVATGSVQPYATAAGFSKLTSLPLWVDVFGDPICETQSQLELLNETDRTVADNKLVHVWKLLLDALLQGDQFYGLSRRQRHALQGQLGCAGRLNQYTAESSLCHYLPYAVFQEDTPAVSRVDNLTDRFTIMWAGSFNTWMDVPTLTRGITDALKTNPNLHLLVVGGKIDGYNEISYGQFLDGIRKADVQGAVTLMDWQPLSAMQKLYSQCDIGISIDRYTYEAELGSRTRLVNFLAAGLPVLSTTVTELSQDLLADGLLMPFELGSAESLTRALLNASQDTGTDFKPGEHCRQYILDKYNGSRWGSELRKWIAAPGIGTDKARANDEDLQQTNGLVTHWHHVREPLGD